MPNVAQPQTEESNVFWLRYDEIAAINERRAELHRPLAQLPDGIEAAGAVLETVGLALSGGGVRSAAVSLGVLQALNYHRVLDKIDYLSTVSGGGYMGCSLTASMTKGDGQFAFGAAEAPGTNIPQAVDVSDTAAVGHIRNYSNYLIPAGLRDLVTGLAIVARGLVANFGLALPVLLGLATLTIWWKPNRADLSESSLFGYPLNDYLPAQHFGLTLAWFLLGLLLFLLWAIGRSIYGTIAPTRQSEYRTQLPFIGATFLMVLLAAFFCEIQPFVIAGMFGTLDQSTAQEALYGWVTSSVKALAATLAPVGAAVMFFRQQLGDIFKSATDGITASLKRAVITSLVWLAGLALPLCIWVLYIYLCFWGIDNNRPAAVSPCPAGSISATVKIASPTLNYEGDLQGNTATCSGAKGETATGHFAHSPRWLDGAANLFGEFIEPLKMSSSPGLSGLASFIDKQRVAFLYLITAVVLFLMTWPLTPNGNSLHRLYRDRLSKAFLFNPARPPAGTYQTVSTQDGGDFPDLDAMQVSELSSRFAPYQLINSALNIQGSDYANRRGRNADFFLFSKFWVGSVATGYAQTEQVQQNCPDLTLATAMAISGAAASSNMGADTIRPLAPTLALLNIRLGYWLRNPAFWAPTGAPQWRDELRDPTVAWTPHRILKAYLWAEITGRLYENSNEVYLTDGGHIENLGIYELLRRRCRVIIAVDAESDKSMHFPSLVTLQRYARIDLGYRINLPWDPIQKTTLKWMNPPTDGQQQPTASNGPHVAIGTIDYGGDDQGYLVYIKSSLTGDENDYIRDYARRNNAFPHESTGDQFFSEEQFEVYRALGFHMTDSFLSSADTVEVVGEQTGTIRFRNTDNEIVQTLRHWLVS